MITTMTLMRHVLRAPDAGMEGGGGAAAAPAAEPVTGGEPVGESPDALTDAPAGDAPSQAEPTAQELMDAYSGEGGESSDEDGEPMSQQEGGEAAEEYALSFSEEFSPDPAFLNLVTPHAKELGIDPAQAGGLVERTIASIQQAEYANMVESDAALKKDWGAEYQSNKQAVESYKVQLREQAGLTKEDMAVFNSPKGYRLLHALMGVTQAKPTAGVGTSSATEASWARDAFNNPSHPDHKALHNPSDPRWAEVNARYNRASTY